MLASDPSTIRENLFGRNGPPLAELVKFVEVCVVNKQTVRHLDLKFHSLDLTVGAWQNFYAPQNTRLLAGELNGMILCACICDYLYLTLTF